MKNRDVYVKQNADQITGLPGREEFFQSADAAVRKAGKENRRSQLQMLYLNVCDFKMYNLHYGTEKGNEMLKRIGETIRHAFPAALLSRLSDDHFVFLLEHPGEKKTFEKLVQNIADLNPRRPLAAKIGICNLDMEPMSALDACDLARAACDSIKRDPAADIAAFTPELRKIKERREYIVHNIDDAVEKGYIEVWYQPVFRAVTKTLCGAEALSRWADPKLGFLSPADFIPVLEETRLITSLDQHVIRTVCRDLRRRIDEGKQVVPVSVNVSKIDFFKIDLPEYLGECMREYRIPSRLINIEVTESMLSGRKETLFQEMQRLQDAGHRVIMDDFGSGYSSLNILKDYPFDVMKLDMEFLSDFSERARRILRCTVNMAKEIGISTVAEGVETEDQFRFLRDAGCEKIQGYYFCRPLSLDKLHEFCESNAVRVECEGCVSAYNAISSQNFGCSLPMSMFLLENDQIHFIYMSREYERELSKINSIRKKNNQMDMSQAAEYSANALEYPINRSLNQKLQLLVPEHPYAAFEFPISYGRIEADYRLISSTEDKKLFLSHVRVKHSSAIQDEKDLDLLRRNLYYLYDDIYLIDMDRQQMYSISSIKGTEEHQSDILPVMLSRFEHLMIHESDRSRYNQYIVTDTLEKRVAQSEGRILSDVFLTRSTSGEYKEKVHQILRAQESERRLYLYFIQDASRAGLNHLSCGRIGSTHETKEEPCKE
ncbi:MAG: putative bifunctional diguanylate cyclase/phosphodiesterase [Eubacterium sp.]